MGKAIFYLNGFFKVKINIILSVFKGRIGCCYMRALGRKPSFASE